MLNVDNDHKKDRFCLFLSGAFKTCHETDIPGVTVAGRVGGTNSPLGQSQPCMSIHRRSIGRLALVRTGNILPVFVCYSGCTFGCINVCIKTVSWKWWGKWTNKVCKSRSDENILYMKVGWLVCEPPRQRATTERRCWETSTLSSGRKFVTGGLYYSAGDIFIYCGTHLLLTCVCCEVTSLFIVCVCMCGEPCDQYSWSTGVTVVIRVKKKILKLGEA